MVREVGLKPVMSKWLLCAALMLGPIAAPALADTIPVYDITVVHTYPHDPQAFTQGLLYRDGFLYESTGMHGRSSIRKVSLETGRVLQQANLPADVFGEGMTAWGNELFGITWQSQTGYVFDLASFKLKRTFAYPGEGWGLTQDGHQLIMSDGSNELRLLDPATLHEVRRIAVTVNGVPVDQLNELEWINGEIYANIWQTDVIARIDPANGNVVGWIDLSGLLRAERRQMGPDDVLNGIAYDPASGRLFVTGKQWPKLFEIKLTRRAGK
jgi:glutaminyl-peptide cyclotransferase